MDFRIKELCKKKGLLFKDLAKQIGITDVGLRQSLQGNPTIGTLEKIAAALEVPVVELFDTPKEGVIHCPKCGAEIKLNPETQKV
jgi:transcriptional regulator with XRE-family HTH domain